MTQFIKLIVIILLITSQVYAASDLENKEDKPLIRNYDNTSFKDNKHVRTKKIGPLGNKKWGIEINLFRLIIFIPSGEKFYHTFSGGISYFGLDRKSELAFPFFYSHWGSPGEYEHYSESIRQIIVDCHYRRFLGKTQNGFYISAFIRYANLKGKKPLYKYDYQSDTIEELVENKFGIGIGIGFRMFTKVGFYWGVSGSIGKYVIGENDVFHDNARDLFLFDNDIDMIYNIELLKFGWAF